MTRPLIIPVDLGGSPHAGLLAPPRRPLPSPELVAALVQHYLTERRRSPEQRAEVAFFHGGIPQDDFLQAIPTELSRRVCCTPADLSPDLARHLGARGVTTIEVELLTTQPGVARALGRPGRVSAHLQLIAGLRDLGFRVGAVLSPGLPGTTHHHALADAEWAAGDTHPRVDFVRLHPAVAWTGSGLAQHAQDGRWTPMTLAEAVTTLHAMMDRLDAAEVPVIRVGQQPGADIPAKVAAGPTHPNLRALVEHRRFLDRMRAALEPLPRRRAPRIGVHPADLSWAKGPANANLRRLRSDLGLPDLTVVPDPGCPRGKVFIHSLSSPENTVLTDVSEAAEPSVPSLTRS